jgi:hypothetical protein
MQRKEHRIINPIVIFLSFLIITEPSFFCVLTNNPMSIPIPVPARDPSAITIRISNASILSANSFSLVIISLIVYDVYIPASGINFFYV